MSTPKVVSVTGGSSGIGGSTTLEYAQLVLVIQ